MVALNNGEAAIIGDSVGAVLWLFFGKNVTEHGPWQNSMNWSANISRDRQTWESPLEYMQSSSKSLSTVLCWVTCSAVSWIITFRVSQYLLDGCAPNFSRTLLTILQCIWYFFFWVEGLRVRIYIQGKCHPKITFAEHQLIGDWTLWRSQKQNDWKQWRFWLS